MTQGLELLGLIVECCCYPPTKGAMHTLRQHKVQQIQTVLVNLGDSALTVRNVFGVVGRNHSITLHLVH